MSHYHSTAIPYLDGWRGLAILAVLLCHFGPRPQVAFVGELGVQMFFALSGFLMGEILFVKKTGLKRFFFRRFSRVIPTFVLFVFCMYAYAHYQAKVYHVSTQELVSTLAFARTYTPVEPSIWNTGWAIGNLWSLNVEEHGYAFLAILALIARLFGSERCASWLLVASISACLMFFSLYSIAPPAGDGHWELRSECAALGLIASAMLRQLKQTKTFELQGSLQASVIALAVVAAALFIFFYRMKGLKVVIVPLSLALIVNYLHTFPCFVKVLLSHSSLIWFGKRSFSIYLWQHPFFEAVQQGILSPLTGLLMGILLGTLSFHCFEDPIRVRLNRFWDSRTSTIMSSEPASMSRP